MPSATSKPESLAAALDTARTSYGKKNTKSQEIHKESSQTLPGGKTFFLQSE
jgi:hypothetical protein